MHAGHGGGKPTDKIIQEVAEQMFTGSLLKLRTQNGKIENIYLILKIHAYKIRIDIYSKME